MCVSLSKSVSLVLEMTWLDLFVWVGNIECILGTNGFSRRGLFLVRLCSVSLPLCGADSDDFVCE